MFGEKGSLEAWRYFGYDRKTFRSCLSQIRKVNKRTSRIVNQILFLMMGMFCILSLLGLVRRTFAPFYGVCLAYAGVTEIIFFCPVSRPDRASLLDIYLSMCGLFAFGIAASVADPSTVATSFLVMQTLVALFLLDEMDRVLSLELAAMAVFDLTALAWKPLAIAWADILNALVYFVVSTMLCSYMQRGKIAQFLANSHFHRMARVDGLSGLLNRQTFFEASRKVLETPGADAPVFAVLDIDHFKRINDASGHQKGDDVIHAVGYGMMRALLSSADPLPESLLGTFFSSASPFLDIEGFYDEGGMDWNNAQALAGRLGGDEFALLVGGVDPMARVRKVADAVAGTSAMLGVDVSCSVGCCTVMGKDLHKAYGEADSALYQAKERGRAQIRVFQGGDR